ncbi:8-oxo-dGTP pyrophosphatase MutT (NUDIX family) [Roseibium hamelinense]|uniref:8-oxo-dGTP pyrophosphatase MutT (NUDIX family) n=1 Tax=Roseibium hamelinense TaxID=150831 RepID=A0A562TH58_9HYPH|nr:NUDIX hydrolase [Roseibium hamelinense]MTI46124.1 NUDIX hydrolase [Roseibium hamelinense]TWI92683.1 8-oxo-dGTP pyrophosphatase MutT (NUDIX family) [Roseibium hamelinense]
MAVLDFDWAPRAPWLRGLVDLFRRPARLQIAALCYRVPKGAAEPEVLLVTTRDTGRWIIPKGWPEPDKPAFETAVIEAYEEAGVVGKPERRVFGQFRSFKGLSNGLTLRTKVLVFKIRATKLLDSFPEKGQRKLAWVPVSQAIEQANEKGLQKLLRRFKAETAV